MNSHTLQLNASFEPMTVIPWERAICMWLDGKVEILATYTQKVYDALMDWDGNMPAVVRLFKYVNVTRRKIKFSRINVFGRDNFTCLYCGMQPGIEDLTYDHVYPRSRGGRTTWENIATACISCNTQKSNRTPEEAGMKLKVVPYKPKKKSFFSVSFKKNDPSTPEEWRDFIYWTQELEN